MKRGRSATVCQSHKGNDLHPSDASAIAVSRDRTLPGCFCVCFLCGQWADDIGRSGEGTDNVDSAVRIILI